MNRSSIYYKQVQLLMQVVPFHQGLTDSEKGFLISFKNREPDWSLLGLEGVSELPAVKWKQKNLAKMPNGKHEKALEKLKSVLNA